uniref:NAC domain-containing protein n=1 Tax=Salix viminalis TaxID=40686 RepID=A0A6N2N8L9_SALVM
MRSLRFYEGAVRTGWMIYEFDLISEPSLFRKGQYVLCKLEFDSEGVKSKKRKRSHRIAPVSRSEVEPSQSMDSDSKNINPSEMAFNSPCDESGLSHQVGLQFGNQNSGELMNSSARQLSEFSHHRTSEFRNQIPDNLIMSDLVHDGSGSSHSTVFNRENQYWNQPTVDSAYNGSESPCMAFDSETQTPNELPAVDSAYNVTSFDLANQNPSVLLAADSASNFVSESRHMTFDPANQTPNVLLTADNSASNVSGSHYMAFDLANKNFVSESRHMTFDLANNSISMLASENSLMASRGSEILEPPFPFPLEGESGNSMVMPFSFINQSTYDKSEPSSLIPSDFDYQNQSKEMDILAFDEGIWSNITAIAPDFVNQNPCKKPDMSAALEEDYSSYSEPFFSYSYLADLSLPEVSPGLQAAIEWCFEEENIPNPAHFQLPACMEENHSFMGGL